MTKIQEFNLQYGLTNISTNAFSKIETIDVANDLKGKPKKNILEIAKRFFTNPVAVSALIVFVAIVLLSIILPVVSHYSSEDGIMQLKANTPDAFKNLPAHGTKITVVADPTLLSRLNNFNVHYDTVSFSGIDPSVIGKTVITYSP